jgi:hypothetical protein
MSQNLMVVGMFLLGGLAAQAGTICGSASQGQACGESSATHKLSPSEVKALLKSASVPEDHWQLAEHFRQEAAEEDQTAAFYEQQADCADAKSHCSFLANNARKASKHDMKIAEEQDKMAQSMLSSTSGGLIHGR